MYKPLCLALLFSTACSKLPAENTRHASTESAASTEPAASPSPDAPRPVPTPAIDAQLASEPDAGEESEVSPAAAPGADELPKNIQVLPKTWSLTRVERYMKEDVVKGVGSKCVHCHNKDDFAADTKHKRQARDMMRLTKLLNDKYFNKKSRVTCFTCHKGKHEPGH